MKLITRIHIIGAFMISKRSRFLQRALKGCYKDMEDEKFLKLKGKYSMRAGTELDLTHPKTFCEKLNWLKINERRHLYTLMVDKYEAKKMAQERLGEDRVVPLLGVWDDFDEIDFDSLPDQFVLKCTHDSGGLIVVKDKSKLNKEEARAKIEETLQTDYYAVQSREWPYKNVHRRIIAEEYVPSLGNADSIEYKVTCFNGKVAFVTRCKGVPHAAFDVRFNDHYDRNFKHYDGYVNYKSSGEKIEKPEQWDDIIRFSELMAKDTYHVRVDFYVIDGKLVFGENTFFSWGGFMDFVPQEWDLILGQNLRLPIDTDETVKITIPGLE